MRRKVVHDYLGVDEDIVWQVGHSLAADARCSGSPTFGLTSDLNGLCLGYMSTQEGRTASARRDAERLTLLQGTLDVLILKTLVLGRQHGQGIARAIQNSSCDALLVEHGALYPALQRLEARKWISARWGTSDNNRKARFYTLTRAGRAQLVRERSRWHRLAAAVGRVLGPENA